MSNPDVSLLFIPDISGFTDFIHQTEIRHSQHIISELLEIMIDANELDMQLAEIEGDALFFYKFRNIPAIEEILRQVKKIYLHFHQHLRLYENRRICQCGACTSAESLELKFVAHCGVFDFINVKGKHKPIGESVITIHRLLKNKIDSNEYLLLTKDLFDHSGYSNLEGWHNLSDIYEHIGEIEYMYRSISHFKKELPDLPEIVVDNIHNPLVVEFDTDVKAPVLDTYELLTNFNLRKLWTKSLQEIHFNNKEINQTGTTHTCVFNNQKIDFKSLQDASNKGKWVYGEQTTDIPLMKKVNTYHTLAPSGTGTRIKTKILLEPKNFIGRVLFIFMKNKFRNNFSAGLRDLRDIAEANTLDKIYKMVEKES